VAALTNWDNFSVTFHMQSPVCLGHPWIAGDGIIAHLINQERRGQDYYTLPSKTPISQNFLYRGQTMPLAQTRDVFHASVAQFDVDKSMASVTTLYKRFYEQQAHEVDTKTPKVHLNRGYFRAYMMRLPIIPARKVTFYFRGNMQEVLRLLSYLPGIGKKVADGYGFYNSVSVEETLENYSLVKDGVAMRPLPCSLGYESNEKMMLAYKAPYWDKRCVEPCVPPGAVLHRFN